MRLGKAVKILLPVGTLLGLGIGWSTLRMSAPQPESFAMPDAKGARLAPLQPQQRTRALEGVVLDARSRPLPDALVFVRGGEIPAWCTSDKEGRFRLERLPEGELIAHLIVGGHAPCTQRIEAQATQAVLRAERAYGAPPALDKRPPVALSGRIESDKDGGEKEWLDGLEVLLVPVDTTAIDGPVPARARSDAQGRFAFGNLLCGRYRALVLPPWAVSSQGPDLLESIAGGENGREFMHEQERTDFRLDISLGALELEFRNAQGMPQEGVVTLLRSGGTPAQWWPPESSDGSGKLLFAPLPPGEYIFEMQAGGWRESRTVKLAADQFRRERAVTGMSPAGTETPR